MQSAAYEGQSPGLMPSYDTCRSPERIGLVPAALNERRLLGAIDRPRSPIGWSSCDRDPRRSAAFGSAHPDVWTAAVGEWRQCADEAGAVACAIRNHQRGRVCTELLLVSPQ